MDQNDFLFGAQSALRYEEYNCIKYNRRKGKQKRVLVIDGHQIYHQKQLTDPKSGVTRQPLNYIPNVQMVNCDENGNIIPGQNLNESINTNNSYNGLNPKNAKKVGYYKAKITNFMKSSFSKPKNKVRFVQDIMQIQ
jgi:hypothetical protein